MPKLYDLDLSGNCHKVRLFASLLNAQGVDVGLTLEPVDFMAGQHKQSPVIDLDPFGELPVFVDGDVVLRDSQAILVYMARKWGGEAWLPTDALGMAQVMQWLSVASNEIARGPNDARLHQKFNYDLDGELARKKTHRILGLMDAHLGRHIWLVLDRPTIADLACLPYITVGHEGGVPVSDYSHVAAWASRIKALPGFVGMPGTLEAA